LTRLRAARPGIYPRQGLGIFFISTTSRRALGPIQPHIQWVLGTLSAGCKAVWSWSWPLTSVYSWG